MKKFALTMILTLVSLFVFASPASAQGTVTPNSEWYVGYQFTNSNAQNFKFADSAHGVNASATWYISDESEQLPIGLTAEGAGNFKNGESLVTVMGGLIYKSRLASERFQPFVRGLAGAARTSTGASDVGFSFAVGGGLDVKAGSTVSLRLLQADYLQTHLFNQTQHSIRLGAGIVF